MRGVVGNLPIGSRDCFKSMQSLITPKELVSEFAEEDWMLKIAILIWMMLGTMLAGSAVTALLTVQGPGASPMKIIPLVALAGFVVAMPLSYLVATRIARAGQGRRAV
jgi:hypothetical protein